MKRYIFLFIFFITPTLATAQTPGSFSTTWDTTQPGTSSSSAITIPKTSSDIGTGYDYSIYWEGISGAGAGATGTVATTTASTDQTIDFGVSGVYRVDIIGDFPRLYPNYGGDADRLMTVEQWGINQWTNMEGMFAGTSNMNFTATDTPDLSMVTDMSYMFDESANFNANINNWDVSNVTNFEGTFFNADAFDQPLNNWDIASATNIRFMFSDTAAFNSSVAGWDISGVTQIDGIFSDTTAFNQPLESWDMSNITSVRDMFQRAAAFNQPLAGWEMGAVTVMDGLFNDATAFDQDINNWDTGSVQDMSNVFRDATAFNQPLNGWDMSSTTDTSFMFVNATAFNQPLDNWTFTTLINTDNMFLGATSFNQDISGWNTDTVTGMGNTFLGASAFNQNLGDWDMGNVLNASGMFDSSGMSADSYSRTLSGWASQSGLNSISLGAAGVQYYDAVTAERAILDNVPNNWTITDAGSTTTPQYTLTYDAGMLATLTGSSSQLVIWSTTTPIVTGTAVTVVPNDGYRFVQWSDGNTTNPRVDTDLTADVSVTAVVEKKSSSGGTRTVRQSVSMVQTDTIETPPAERFTPAVIEDIITKGTIEEKVELINFLTEKVAELRKVHGNNPSGSSAGQSAGSDGVTRCVFDRDLTGGATGEDVTCLQQYLTSTGHYTYPDGLTGYFGRVTREAVAAWQTDNQIYPAQGYWGPFSIEFYSQ